MPCSVQAAEIALIIDDVGNKPDDAAVFTLPVEVAVSILPLTYLSERFSAQAAKQNREVMLHMPMESLGGRQLGPGAITSDMPVETIRATLLKALETVPHAIGVNNHMGSKLTQLTTPMSATMGFLTDHQLFFVDSRTTRYSRAAKIAQRFGVPVTQRNVFLDHDIEEQAIDYQFQRLLRLARKYDYAVGIAHPYPETMAYLNKALAKLEEQGVKLIQVSEIVHLQELAKQEKAAGTSSVALK